MPSASKVLAPPHWGSRRARWQPGNRRGQPIRVLSAVTYVTWCHHPATWRSPSTPQVNTGGNFCAGPLFPRYGIGNPLNLQADAPGDGHPFSGQRPVFERIRSQLNRPPSSPGHLVTTRRRWQSRVHGLAVAGGRLARSLFTSGWRASGAGGRADAGGGAFIGNASTRRVVPRAQVALVPVRLGAGGRGRLRWR